jgi:hypothetical protein
MQILNINDDRTKALFPDKIACPSSFVIAKKGDSGKLLAPGWYLLHHGLKKAENNAYIKK